MTTSVQGQILIVLINFGLLLVIVITSVNRLMWL